MADRAARIALRAIPYSLAAVIGAGAGLALFEAAQLLSQLMEGTL